MTPAPRALHPGLRPVASGVFVELARREERRVRLANAWFLAAADRAAMPAMSAPDFGRPGDA